MDLAVSTTPNYLASRFALIVQIGVLGIVISTPLLLVFLMGGEKKKLRSN
jgi:hypothetical protein